ncbi:MAG: DUF892 family protein [Ginsengibacter sp.]
MDKIIDLKDLLKHEVLDLYSAEEQIIEALPSMIENARKPELKEALSNHLEVTRSHKDRLDQIKKIIMGDETEEQEGFFSNLFGGSNKVTSKGISGLIDEATRLMNEDMTPEAMDAAIIGSAQKIEHYEIAGYGTARAYAVELKLNMVVNDLEKTLNEEYDADDKLTKLAVGKVNPDAENAVVAEAEVQEPADDDYQRITNSVSIMSSSEPDDYDE